MLFKDGIHPKWEDPLNSIGGSLILELKDITAPEIDLLWKKICFALIGNNISHCDKISGFRILDRLKINKIKIELWLQVGLSSHKKDSPKYQDNF
jgi:hypothetical protein